MSMLRTRNPLTHLIIPINWLVFVVVISMQTTQATQPANNYNDCFQAAMIGESGNIAERNAQITCREQFPKTIPGETLPAEVIDQLTIEAGFGWGIFSGRIYNGSNNYFITQLIVRMKPIHDGHHMDMDMHAHMSHEAKLHQIDLNLAPQTKSAISMALPDEDAHVHDFEWEVVQLIGYKTD